MQVVCVPIASNWLLGKKQSKSKWDLVLTIVKIQYYG